MSTRNALMIFMLAVLLGLPAAATATMLPRANDEDIAAWVRAALQEDPRVYSADLQVTSADGVVTISGTVWNLAERRYALREAKKIRGVRAVIDQIEVAPEARADDTIRGDIARRLADDPDLPADRIAVSVTDGVADLTGTVDSYTEKQEAGTVAGEVLGLKDLRNDLTTHWDKTRSDAEIARDVKATLARDVYLTDQPIDTSVDDGIVKLTGEVGTAYQKERADELAWVDNVKDVKDELQVHPWLSEGVRRSMPVPTDEQVSEAVTASLRQDLRIDDPYRINVLAHDGSITLRGVVPNRSEWRLADQDARDVVGVGWVTNLLMVNPARKADEEIREDVRFDLDTDWALSAQEIGVRVDRGVVTLTGTVNTPFEKAHATEVAGREAGVSRVVNDLDVSPGPAYTDASIKDRIEERLNADWMTSWQQPDITVDVHEGSVKLTGKVKTWAERAEAGRIAFGTSGVWTVQNDIAVADTDYPWATAGYTGPRAGREKPSDFFHFYYFDIPL